MDTTKLEIELNAELMEEINRLRTHIEFLQAERDDAVNAINDCVNWANGRESEWGDRAENAFNFLYRFLANDKIHP